ncbi:hypothetical protein IPM19_02560 [bacterium]|nr:MAG: hypothetical protein IPM19_02560 [bacterium]
MSERRHSLDIIPDIGVPKNGFELQHREEVFLSEQTEQRIEQDTLPGFLSIAKEAGANEEELDRLEACYKALGRRPSQIGVSYGFHFSNDGKYFGPVVGLDRHYHAMPDVLSGTDFKIRPGVEKPKIAPVDSDRIMDTFAKARIMFSSTDNQEYRDKVNAYEKSITKINRIMYRVHDALHIYQNILIGDEINALKSKFSMAGWTNEDVERRLIKRGNYAKLIDWQPPKWAKDSIFTNQDVPEYADIPDHNPQVVNNEATMDVMSEWLLKEELSKEPELMLWLHNTITHAVDGLKAIREQYQSINNLDNADTLPHKQIEHILNMISAAYFAVYENSEQAKSDLIEKEYSVAGRPAQATIAEGSYFDRCTVLNLISELHEYSELIIAYHGSRQFGTERDARAEEYMAIKKNKASFPSGQEWSAQNYVHGPITTKGVETAAKITASVAENKGNLDDLMALFMQIQSSMDESSTPETQQTMQTAVAKRIKNLYGMDLNSNDILEMRNIFHYIDMSGQLSKDKYPYQYVIRKKIMEQMKNAQPEQINQLIKWTVFEFPMYFRKGDYLELTGFGEVATEETRMDAETRKVLPWEKILASHKLGLFNINMKALPPEQIAEIKALYDRGYKKHDHTEDLRILANIAKMQKQIA